MMCSHMLRCNPKMEGLGLLALRVAIGFVFIYSGYTKLFVNTAMAIGMFGQMGFPAANFWVHLVGILELVGGLMVLLGAYARLAGVWLSAIMVVAILTAHWGGPVMGYFLPATILGGCLALAGVGAGPWRLVKCECPCPKCKAACAAMSTGGCGDMKGGCGCGGKGACCSDKMMGGMKSECGSGSCGGDKMCACGSGKPMDMCCGMKK